MPVTDYEMQHKIDKLDNQKEYKKKKKKNKNKKLIRNTGADRRVT